MNDYQHQQQQESPSPGSPPPPCQCLAVSATRSCVFDQKDEDDNPLPPPTLEVTAEATAAPSQSPLLAAANDAAVAKQRRRRLARQQDDEGNSTNNLDNSTAAIVGDEEEPGAFQVDERAPGLSARFFRGLAGSAQRLRAREERAAARRRRNADVITPSRGGMVVEGISTSNNNSSSNRNTINDNSSSSSSSSSDGSSSSSSSDGSSSSSSSDDNSSNSSCSSIDDNISSSISINNGSSNNFNVSMGNIRSLLSRFATQNNPHRDLVGDDLELGLVSATLVDEGDVVFAEMVDDLALPPPDSDVERIVRRLELRNANRVPVPMDVKHRFLRLCDDVNRRRILFRESNLDGGLLDCSSGSADGGHLGEGTINNEIKISPCILREDVINLRNSIRLEVESRTRLKRMADGMKRRVGFRCQCEVLLHVFNRAVDIVDSSSHIEAQKRRRRNRESMGGTLQGSTNGGNMQNGIIRSRVSFADVTEQLQPIVDQGYCTEAEGSDVDAGVETSDRSNGDPSRRQQNEEEDAEWFYYKDFLFYNLKVESKYPWMRSVAAKSILVTLAFLLFTPVLWCGILRDEK